MQSEVRRRFEENHPRWGRTLKRRCLMMVVAG